MKRSTMLGLLAGLLVVLGKANAQVVGPGRAGAIVAGTVDSMIEEDTVSIVKRLQTGAGNFTYRAPDLCPAVAYHDARGVTLEGELSLMFLEATRKMNEARLQSIREDKTCQMTKTLLAGINSMEAGLTIAAAETNATMAFNAFAKASARVSAIQGVLIKLTGESITVLHLEKDKDIRCDAPPHER